ncbi:MAG: ATP-binding protein [Ignavibacteria bacterium]|nr:ATP-binding protein [Ignavibacteria bacterium]
MLDFQNKGRSPFYPGQPVPVELFTGRKDELSRIEKSFVQSSLGKMQVLFLTGEYGIGKSSLANYSKTLAEKNYHLLGIHVFLGNTNSVEGLAQKTVETILREQLYNEKVVDKIKNFLSKYIGKQELFGLSINFEALKNDALDISKGFLPFLKTLFEKIKEENFKGIFLILDEINGISKNPEFAHFIKTFVDENATSTSPLPLTLMLCGTEERRKEIVSLHPPTERIFDVIKIETMNKDEMSEFFSKAFNSVDMEIESNALDLICEYSSGYPKIMHIIGDCCFWVDKDKVVDINDAYQGIFIAAEEIGRRFIDVQVLNAIQSKDYRTILSKIVEIPKKSFSKKELEQKLSPSEKKKLHNFLQRMKKLKAIKSLERGNYEFVNSMIPLYLYLFNIKTKKINQINKISGR